MSNTLHSSNHNDGNAKIMKDFNIRKKITSNLNRYRFLKDCLAEMMIPKSAPVQLHKSKKPFCTSARAYLEDACSDLKDKLYELKDELLGTRLPDHLKTKLMTLNERQRNNLNQKLQKLCNTSKWKDAGNATIVTNLATRRLSPLKGKPFHWGLNSIPEKIA